MKICILIVTYCIAATVFSEKTKPTQLQIDVEKSIPAEQCQTKSMNGDKLSMHYTVSKVLRSLFDILAQYICVTFFLSISGNTFWGWLQVWLITWSRRADWVHPWSERGHQRLGPGPVGHVRGRKEKTDHSIRHGEIWRFSYRCYIPFNCHVWFPWYLIIHTHRVTVTKDHHRTSPVRLFPYNHYIRKDNSQLETNFRRRCPGLWGRTGENQPPRLNNWSHQVSLLY